MPDSTAVRIPYERQIDPTSNRMCGAAALSMVYRSFGMTASQLELAPRLRGTGSSGSLAARSHLLAQHALDLGLSALVLRAKAPLRTLEECHEHGLRVILNHRPHRESPNGHFTVLVDVAGDSIVVHDPLAGPSTRILHDDLLELWQPLSGLSEITGNVMIVLAKDQPPAGPCPECGKVIPESLTCPGCGQPVPLRPASVLGCISTSCPQRAWAAVFCPHCDRTLSDDTKKSRVDSGARPSGAGETRGREQDSVGRQAEREAIDDIPLKIQSLNQEIDKFVAILLSVNNGRPVPGAEPYFATIRQCQSQLLELQKTQAADRRAKAAQPPAAPSPAPAPPLEPVAAKPPRPQVDWKELARKLVEEMGYRVR
jgi:hypothetical protein